MQQGISSHLFLPRRLSPALLDTLAQATLTQAGAAAIEVFAARHHFDYTNTSAVREVANWFRSNNVVPTLHMPLYPDTEWSRHVAPTLNLIDTSKAARIDAQDEVKRALESAEQIPFRTCILHLGMKEDRWDTRSLDASLTAIEHLKAFAGPLGIKLLLENLSNEVATPAHLVEIVRVGHFSNIGFCLDTGHANLTGPTQQADEPDTRNEDPTSTHPKSAMTEAFAAFGANLTQLHLHDNHGLRDEHLWPLEKPEPGSIHWPEVTARIAALKTPPIGTLEIAHELGEDEKQVPTKAAAAWKLLTS
jgi:sugar phosphate isomerase/epimerase